MTSEKEKVNKENIPAENVFSRDSLPEYYDHLSRIDILFKKIIKKYGYPTFTLRTPGFECLVRLILEQQVSLLSAKAAFQQLRGKVGTISPETILGLTDDELKRCYFSRQKTRYVKILAQACVDQKVKLHELSFLPDDEVRAQLIQLTGIGAWTADNYLLLALNRTDIFPVGDIALVNSLRKSLNIPHSVSKEELLAMADRWKPYRSIATLLFWHVYCIDRNILVDKLNY